MDVKIFYNLPQDAINIRTEVFIKEQGFLEELDETDSLARHIILYDGGKAVATCRVFPGEEKGSYILGRLAVVREYRGRGIGAAMLKAAEEFLAAEGVAEIKLHSQVRAMEFYRKSGYIPYGEVEDEEGCPHIWMKKGLGGPHEN